MLNRYQKDARDIYVVSESSLLTPGAKPCVSAKNGDKHIQTTFDYASVLAALEEIGKNTSPDQQASNQQSSNSNAYDDLSGSSIVTKQLFKAESANALRAFSDSFNHYQINNVLVIGAFSSTSIAYLSESAKKLTVVDFNYDRLSISRKRLSDKTNINFVCDNFSDTDTWPSFDLVVSEGASDFAKYWLDADGLSAMEAHALWLDKVISLAKSNGQLFISADNTSGTKYMLGATDERSLTSQQYLIGYDSNSITSALTVVHWQQLLKNNTALSNACVEEYYAYPDYRLSEVILGKGYVDNNTNAWQHLNRVYSQDYVTLQINEGKEHLLLSALSQQNHIGLYANSICYVINKNASNTTTAYDFIHVPKFERQIDFLNIIRKRASSNEVERVSLARNEVVTVEAFAQGEMLSLQWISALLSTGDNQGLDAFNAMLRKYYQFLLSLNEGYQGGLDIDSVPNNIIVDDNNQYQSIDKEWQDKFTCTPEFVFYRGLWIFLHRNLHFLRPHLHKTQIRSVKDFIFHAFYQASIPLNESVLTSYYQQDIAFLSEVSGKQASYDLNKNLLVKPIDENKTTLVTLSSLAVNKVGEAAMQTDTSVSVSYQPNYQTILFDLGSDNTLLQQIRLFPYLHNKQAMCYGFKRIAINAVAPDKSKKLLWSCDGEKAIIAANETTNIPLLNVLNNEGLSSDANEKRLMIFSLHDYLSFSFDQGLPIDAGDSLVVEVELIYDEHPAYQLAKQNYLQRWQAIEQENQAAFIHNEANLAMAVERNQVIEAELATIQSSTIWRIMTAYSDIFRVNNEPKKNIIQKLMVFVKRCISIVKG